MSPLADTAASQLVELPLAEIARDPDQPRKSFPLASLQELADSYRQHGILQPVTVTPNHRVDADALYLLMLGERRYLAAQLVGLATIPAILRTDPLTPADRLLAQIAENGPREALTLLERAAAFVRAADLFGRSDAEFCAHARLATATMSKYRWLLRREGPVKEALLENRLAGLESVRRFDLLPPAQQLRLLRAARRCDDPDEPAPITRAAIVRAASAAEARLVAYAAVNLEPPDLEMDPEVEASVQLLLPPAALSRLLARLGLSPSGDPEAARQALYRFLDVPEQPTAG